MTGLTRTSSDQEPSPRVALGSPPYQGGTLLPKLRGLVVVRVIKPRSKRSTWLNYPAMVAGVGFEPTTSPL